MGLNKTKFFKSKSLLIIATKTCEVSKTFADLVITGNFGNL
jgi:hypothetical protein